MEQQAIEDDAYSLIPYRALATAIIHQCVKDAQGEVLPHYHLPETVQRQAQWHLEHSPVIHELCELLDLPHADIVRVVHGAVSHGNAET